MSKFAERLKELREENNLSQHQLATLIGISHNAISLWERRLRTPNFDDVIKFAIFFKVSTDYFAGLED